MDIIVTPDPAVPTRGLVRWRARAIPCALGRSGTIAASAKREGDGATPAGRFALRRVLWRPDRGIIPATALACEPIGKNDGWCDDPACPEYNRPVSLPFVGSAEHLWRDDRLYDVVVILGHNDEPPEPGLGSAIFLHVAAANFAPTQGCVAIDEGALRTVLAEATPGDCLIVEMPAAR